MTQGPASAGFCDEWTFTLPWTPVRQYLVNMRVMTSDWKVLGGDMIGNSPGDIAFTSSVGSTSRSIRSSNLPMFYVLPDSYELKVGEPAVYRAFALGGASIKSSDVWSILYENTPERHAGSAVLTFYPKVTGHITVCLSRDYSAGRQLNACFDPPVKRGSGSGSGSGSTPAPATSAEPGPSGSAGVAPTVAAPADPSPTAGAVAVGGPTATVSPTPTGTAPEGPGDSGSVWLALAALGLAAAGAVALGHPGMRGRLDRTIRSLRRVPRVPPGD